MLEDRAELIFGVLVRVATQGRRCPTNAEIANELQELGLKAATGGISALMGQLALAGRIVVRVYAKNWRMVEITSGACLGMKTLPPPRGGEPYTVIDATERAERLRRGPGRIARYGR